MGDFEMERRSSMYYRIHLFYYFIERPFLPPQLLHHHPLFATYFAHIRHNSIFELALVLE
jgi:hypothetical protein